MRLACLLSILLVGSLGGRAPAPQVPVIGELNSKFITPGVCTLGRYITAENDGSGWGSFKVAISPSDALGIGESILLVNKDNPGPDPKNPTNRFVLGWLDSNRAAHVFKGKVTVACYRCKGSGARDPNGWGPLCANPLTPNTCLLCDTEELDCSEVLRVIECAKTGGERLVPEPGSMLLRLGLTQDKPKKADTKK